VRGAVFSELIFRAMREIDLLGNLSFSTYHSSHVDVDAFLSEEGGFFTSNAFFST